MDINVWPKINEIHQRWLTNESTVKVIEEILLSIKSERDLKNIYEKVNGTSYYSVSKFRSYLISSQSCISPRPKTPTNLYPSKSPRSPRRTLSIDYKKDVKQFKTSVNTSSDDIVSENGVESHLENLKHNNNNNEILKELPNPSDLYREITDKQNNQAHKRQNKQPIARFYFPRGIPCTHKEVESFIFDIKGKLNKLSLSDNTIPRSKLGEIVKIVNIPYYWKQPFYLCCKGKANKPLKVDDILSCLKLMLTNCGTEESKFLFIMTKGGLRNFLERFDFEPLLRDVLETHPGLEFLQSSVDFHIHYINTVIARIFFNVDQNWDDKLSLTEIRKSDLLWVLNYLEKHDDINMVTQYFSYEHFYVIYCKFWELDEDHNLLISRDDLVRHNNYALSERIIDRIFEGTVLRKPLSDRTMCYAEFVWFLLAEEDKQHPRSIEYWFRLMDLDGDGKLSIYELEYFYEEQSQRMEDRCIEPLSFTDCLCMMLDMVQPKMENVITIADLKKCKQATIFFNTFINLYKYLEHEQSDPFNNLRDIEEGLTELSDWDRFASETYEQLVMEDQQQILDSSNE